MRSWMSGNVEFAKHYMERFYEKKDFRTRNKPIVDEMQGNTNTNTHTNTHISI